MAVSVLIFGVHIFTRTFVVGIPQLVFCVVSVYIHIQVFSTIKDTISTVLCKSESL